MASQITTLTIVYSTVYSGADQRKHQSYASLVFMQGIHRWPVNSPHKGPVTRKMIPFDDVIMFRYVIVPWHYTCAWCYIPSLGSKCFHCLRPILHWKFINNRREIDWIRHLNELIELVNVVKIWIVLEMSRWTISLVLIDILINLQVKYISMPMVFEVQQSHGDIMLFFIFDSISFQSMPQTGVIFASFMASQHYNDVIMGAMGFQITTPTIVYSTAYSSADQRKSKAPRHWLLCTANSPVTGEFPAQMASNEENVCHHELEHSRLSLSRVCKQVWYFPFSWRLK